MKVYTKFLLVLVLFVISVFILSSCDKQQGVIEDYTALVEEIETDGENFTEQDWEDFSSVVRMWRQKCSSTHLTKSKRRSYVNFKVAWLLLSVSMVEQF